MSCNVMKGLETFQMKGMARSSKREGGKTLDLAIGKSLEIFENSVSLA